jgi:cation transport regulator ChaC
MSGNTLISILGDHSATASAESSAYYFAYGSNMNLEQIRSRCSRPEVVSAARLSDFRLSFYGHSVTWDGALETVESAPGSHVWGVLFRLSHRDWENLDDCQDARMDGSGAYFHSPATVTDREGREHFIRLYRKNAQGEPRDPSREYLEHIVRGATENGLPADYIAALQNRPATKASYPVPKGSRFDPAKSAGNSCNDCSSGS